MNPLRRDRFPQIPPQGPPPGRRALRRTAAPGKNLAGSPRAALPAAKPATLRGSHGTFFSRGVARSPAPGAGSRSAAGRGAAGAARGAARALPGSCSGRPSPRFSTSGRWSGSSTAARVVRLQPTTRTSQRSTTTASRTSPEPRRRGAATSPGPASLRATWFGSRGSKAGLPDFGERPGYDGKAVDSHGPDQSQDRQDPRRRLGKARDDRRRREDRQR